MIKVCIWLDVAIIFLAIVTGVLFAIQQAISPWWVVLIWLVVVIISRVELIILRKS